VDVYLGLGSNLGDRRANLSKALKALGKRLDIVGVSSVYETEPVGYAEQPLFLNAVCMVQTDIGPMQLLTLIKGVESIMGRKTSFPNSPRVIDIDIILYGDLIMVDPELTIPHPRMAERAFVLIPLLELAPHLVHPFTGETIEDLLAKIGGKDGVKKSGKLEADYV
jgi:2-amino-4-hydroxy-6-hydroxymethyldihydropteridine diphosphokinase